MAGEYASVFAKSNVVDLKEKLCGLTADGYSFAHTKQEIAEYITEKYKWEEIVEETLKLYQGSKHENINGK